VSGEKRVRVVYVCRKHGAEVEAMGHVWCRRCCIEDNVWARVQWYEIELPRPRQDDPR